MRVSYASASDVGKVRSANQDAVYADESTFLVADGMGGHAGGGVASSTAVKVIVDLLRQGEDPMVAIQEANRAIFERGMKDSSLAGMGTTLTLAKTDGTDGALNVFNIGDSRAYLLRQGRLRKLTNDHTFVQELVDAGSITVEQASTHHARHVLTRALGVDPEVEVDRFFVPIEGGDTLLICSDGLVNEVAEGRIAELLADLEPSEAVKKLVEEANANGGNDNISVVVARFHRGDGDDHLVSVAAGHKESRATVSGVATAPKGSAPTGLVVSDIPSPIPKSAVERPMVFRPVLRLLGFVAVLVLFFLAIVVAIALYVNHSYYVGVAGKRVAIYQGRIGGLLWFKPHVVQDTDLTVSKLTPAFRSQVTHGVPESSFADARSFVANMKYQLSAFAHTGSSVK